MEYNDLILDMLNRIVKLEKEVEQLKKERGASFEEAPRSCTQNILPPDCPSQRDKTRYLFNGNVYLKNKLVLAVIKDYVANNRSITCNELKTVFDKSLQGSIGVVENENVAEQRRDYQVRFFIKDNDILHLVDGDMLVCSQWGILNISNFIKRAEQLGYKIEQIVRE